MKYYRTIFVIGLWVIIIPFLGVPLIAKKILLLVPGLLLIFIGILLSQEKEPGMSDAGISYAETIPDSDEVLSPIDEEDKVFEKEDEFEAEEDDLLEEPFKSTPQ